jgi:uncharacterized membrane protein YkvA (DUF1232 family)
MTVKAGRFAVLSAVVAALRGARAAGAPPLGERVRAIPRLVVATVSGRYSGVGRGRLAGLAAGALYVISPVDLMPEIILPLIGLGDDLVVLTFVVSGLLVETERFIAWERAGKGVPTAPQGGGPVVRGEVVDGRPTRSR